MTLTGSKAGLPWRVQLLLHAVDVSENPKLDSLPAVGPEEGTAGPAGPSNFSPCRLCLEEPSTM